MTKFDRFATDDLERLVLWALSRGGRLTLVDSDSSNVHAIWSLVVGEAQLQLVRDFRNWTIAMQFPGTKLFPVADWEHALKGDPMLADVLDVREEVEFLVSEFDRLVDFPPIELNDRLADYAEQYRLKMLG